MSIQDAYDDWSASYDRDENLTRDLDRLVTQQALGNRAVNTVLEAGCGTGKNTQFFAATGRRVCAMDFSRGMMEIARAKIQTTNLDFVLADITRPWPCEANAFNLVSCNLILEHIRELPPVFSEAARVLARDGTFFICELHPFKQYQGRKAVFSREAGEIEIEAFVHHISDFTRAAATAGLNLIQLNEHWHELDEGKPPRLVSLLFGK